MKALILAAGYATRLQPLTDSVPKQLLPVGGRPMVDWILDKIREAGIDDVHLVTNARFAADFEPWGAAQRRRDPRRRHDDERDAARRDRRHPLRAGQRRSRRRPARDRRRQPLRVLARRLHRLLERAEGRQRPRRLRRRRPRARDAVRRSSTSTTTTRIVGFVEKPADPPIDALRDRDLPLCATARRARRDLPRRRQSARPARVTSSPGSTAREPVYAYRIAGGWYDIGDAAQLLEADNRLRAARRPPPSQRVFPRLECRR